MEMDEPPSPLAPPPAPEPEPEPVSVTDEKIDEFDEILEVIGTNGPFQKFLLYAVVCPIIAVLPLVTYNTMFMHNEMDHWCYHKVMDTFNSSGQLEAWKTANLPVEKGSDGISKFSNCKMYADSGGQGGMDRHRPIIDCPNGWVYDKSELTASINSDFNWVCSKSHYLTTMYTAAGIGTFIGALVFGLLADKYGRKPIFFIGLFVFLAFRILSLFVPSHFTLYVAAMAISSSGFQPIYVIPTMVIAEMCDDGFRSWTFAFTAIVWVSGMASIPYVAYLCQTWFLLGAVTTLPCLALFAYIPVFPESPRWLISVGRIDEAAALIKQIAVRNGTEDCVSDKLLKEILKQLVQWQVDRDAENGDNNIGVWTLFSKRNLAKNTVFLTLSMTVSSFLYDGITLNTPNLPGDQFLNFFLLAMIEIPSNYLGGRLVESLGRRWTQVIFFGISGVTCVVAMSTISNPKLSMAVTISILVSKFAVTIAYLVVSLQLTELFPTPLRSTGNSFAATVTGIVALGSPGMVYMGHFYAPSPYIIMGSMAVAAMIGSAFLPETLGQHLPETIDAANNFGMGTKFWVLRPKMKERKIKFDSLRERRHPSPAVKIKE